MTQTRSAMTTIDMLAHWGVEKTLAILRDALKCASVRIVIQCADAQIIIHD